MAKLSQTDLPDCWILDRGTIKWQRKTYTVVGIMDLLSRKVMAWDLLRPLKPKPVAQVLTNALTVYGKPLQRQPGSFGRRHRCRIQQS